ncbi:MAG: type II toxin-antitoxin system RelE/ParE family toxin [Nitrospinota bacterium]
MGKITGNIFWKASAERDLRKKVDRQYIPKILTALDALTENPFAAKCRKLKGSESSYRIRIGDYRVVYQVNTKDKTVVIIHIRHRREVYRG